MKLCSINKHYHCISCSNISSREFSKSIKVTYCCFKSLFLLFQHLWVIQSCCKTGRTKNKREKVKLAFEDTDLVTISVQSPTRSWESTHTINAVKISLINNHRDEKCSWKVWGTASRPELRHYIQVKSEMCVNSLHPEETTPPYQI